MNLLKLCTDMFGKNAILLPKFRDMLAKEREGKEDRDFFNYLIDWLGGRSYNKFLDYSLLAIKINYIFKNMQGVNEDSWYGTKGNDVGDIKNIINCLLYDDRHDLCQNMPYALDRVYDLMKEGKDKDNFWKYMVNAVISCINTRGTGDTTECLIISED